MIPWLAQQARLAQLSKIEQTARGCVARSRPFSVKSRNATDILVPAARYVRMSTDHQRYSTAAPSEANRAYAAQHRMAIVRTYADEGKSALNIVRREALKRLNAATLVKSCPL